MPGVGRPKLSATARLKRRERQQLTALMFDALRAHPGPSDYPGGVAKMLSDLLVSWGVPVGADAIRNIAAEGRKELKVTN
jgi:hypothetical protein